MDTLVLKTSVAVNNDINLKYHVYKKIGNSGNEYYPMFRPYNNTDIEVITYNGAIISVNYSQVSLIDSYYENSDLVRIYNIHTDGNHKQYYHTIKTENTVTKLLINSCNNTIMTMVSGDYIGSSIAINDWGTNLANWAQKVYNIFTDDYIQIRYTYCYGNVKDILNLLEKASKGIDASQDVKNLIHGDLKETYSYIQKDTSKWRTASHQGQTIPEYAFIIKNWDISGDAYALGVYLSDYGLRNVLVGFSSEGTKLKYKAHNMAGLDYKVYIDNNGEVSCWKNDTNLGW